LKIIEKNNYIDLNELSEEMSRMLKSFNSARDTSRTELKQILVCIKSL